MDKNDTESLYNWIRSLRPFNDTNHISKASISDVEVQRKETDTAMILTTSDVCRVTK